MKDWDQACENARDRYTLVVNGAVPVVVLRKISMIEKHYKSLPTERDAHLVSGSLLPGNGLYTTKRDAQRSGTYRTSTTFAMVCPLHQRHTKPDLFNESRGIMPKVRRA
jgi:hypothetical protein